MTGVAVLADMKEHQQHKELVTTARITGVWYLMLAISGMVGFLILHSRIYVGDAAQTLTNLVEHTTLARTRLSFEFLVVVSQALTAVWFYKLFKDINHTAAWAMAAWGMVNAVAILISAMAMGGAIAVATGTQPLNEKLIMIQIFDQFIKNGWGMGGLFFGLWLIPMGYVVASSRRMPVWLGRVLMLGGCGYIASTFIQYFGITDSWIGLLAVLASVGEFWIIGYLLIFGIRPDDLESPGEH
jgi:hypothetical protein